MFKKVYRLYSAFYPSLRFTLSLQSAFYTQSAFYPWSSVCSLQSAVCVLHWPDFYHGQLLVFRIVKIKITIVTLITSYTNLSTLKLDTHSSVQTLIDFTHTLLTFRFVIASMRSSVFVFLDNFLCFSLSSRTSPLWTQWVLFQCGPTAKSVCI